MECFVHFDLEMCFAPQRRAIFHVSSGQLAPHPPLWRAYFSTLRSPKSLEKHSVSRLSYLFTHLHLLSSYSFSSTLLSSNLSLLSASSLLCFSSVHIVGSLTSKLPSIIIFGLGYKPTNITGGTILYELEKKNDARHLQLGSQHDQLEERMVADLKVVPASHQETQ